MINHSLFRFCPELILQFANNFLYCCDSSKDLHKRIRVFNALIESEYFENNILDPINIQKYIEISSKKEHKNISYKNFFDLYSDYKIKGKIKDNFEEKLSKALSILPGHFFEYFIMCCDSSIPFAARLEKYDAIKKDRLFLNFLDSPNIVEEYSKKCSTNKNLDFSLFFNLDSDLLPRYILFRNELYQNEIENYTKKFLSYCKLSDTSNVLDKITDIFQLRTKYTDDKIFKELLDDGFLVVKYLELKNCQIMQPDMSKQTDPSIDYKLFFSFLPALIEKFEKPLNRSEELFAKYMTCLSKSSDFDARHRFNELVRDKLFLELLDSSIFVDQYLNYQTASNKNPDDYKNFFELDDKSILPKKYLQSFEKKLSERSTFLPSTTFSSASCKIESGSVMIVC